MPRQSTAKSDVRPDFEAVVVNTAPVPRLDYKVVAVMSGPTDGQVRVTFRRLGDDAVMRVTMPAWPRPSLYTASQLATIQEA